MSCLVFENATDNSNVALGSHLMWIGFGFYDRYLKDHALSQHFKAFTDLLEHPRVKQNFPDKYGVAGDIIDIGCGTAMLSEFCKGHNYRGADLPHVVAGCAMRNYPQYLYRGFDIYNDSIDWISQFDIIILNAVLDIMQYPLAILRKVVSAMSLGAFLIIHRQEITKEGSTKIIQNGSYGSLTYHAILAKKEFEDILFEHDCQIIHETSPGFSNWEDGGKSFLIHKYY